MKFFEFLAQLPLTVNIIGLGGAMVAAVIYIVSLNRKREIDPKLIKAIENDNQAVVMKLIQDKKISWKEISDIPKKDRVSVIKRKMLFEFLIKMIIPVLALILFSFLLAKIIDGYNITSEQEQKTKKVEQQEIQDDKVSEVVKPKIKNNPIINNNIEPHDKEEVNKKITKEYIVTFSNTGADKIVIDDGNGIKQTIKNGIENGTFSYNKVKSNTFKLYLYDNNKLIHDTDGYDFNLEKDTTVISFMNGKALIR